MNNARREFFSAFIDENSDNQRKLFRATARLLKPSSVIPLPQCDDDKVLANNFGNYSISKIARIHTNLNSFSDVDQPVPPDEVTYCGFSSFDEIHDETDKDLLSEAPSKSCSLDPIPTDVLKIHSDILVSILTRIVNLSLQSGCFPGSWKNAVISPTLKRDVLRLSTRSRDLLANCLFYQN